MRRPVLSIVAFLALVAASPGREARGEPSPAERALLEALVSALQSGDERLAGAAAKGLVPLGRVAADHLLACRGSWPEGQRARFDDTLVALGHEARAAIQAISPAPVGAEKARFDAIVERIEDAVGFGDSPAKTTRRIESIMAELPKGTWPVEHPAVARIVALGRDAIPRLVQYLDPDREDEGVPNAPACATEALVGLCTPDDVPRLGRLLAKGRPALARVLEGMGRPEAVPWLLAAVEKGHLSHEVGSALLAFVEPAMREPLVKHLQHKGDLDEEGTRHVVDVLVRLRAKEIVPTLQKLANREQPRGPTFTFFGMRQMGPPPEHEPKVVCGCALARLGDASGVTMLIDVLDAGGSDAALAHEAGTCLDAVTGLEHWRSRTSPYAARRAYRTWWLDHELTLAWDEEQRRFRPQ